VIVEWLFLCRLELTPTFCFLTVAAISNRIQCRLEIRPDGKFKGLEHFTENAEKGGGHGEVVRADRGVHAKFVLGKLRLEMGAGECFL
jgi:hypothetical protein